MAYPEDPQRFLIDGPSGTAALRASPPTSPESADGEARLGALRVVVLFLLTLAACTLFYLAFAVHGKWWASVPERGFNADKLVMARGSAVREGDELVITREGPGGETVVSVVTDLRSADYPLVTWIAADVPDSAQVVLLWHTDFQPSQVNKLAVRVVSGRLLPTWVGADQHWIGRVTGLALAIHGPLTQPIRVRGVIAKPADAKGTMLDRLREWTAFEPWTGTSINTVTGGADIQDLPLPLLIVVSVAIAVAVLGWRLRKRWSTNAPTVAIAAVGLFVAGWFLLDARWTFNLVRQARDTAARYAHKDWQEKHLAADDGALFAFIEKARKSLPAKPARVFVLADADYFRGRAAYHLYPHNVWYDPYANTVPPAERLHAGDFIVVYQRRGVQYDASLQRLRWDGGVTVPVEFKVADGGGALFVVR